MRWSGFQLTYFHHSVWEHNETCTLVWVVWSSSWHWVGFLRDMRKFEFLNRARRISRVFSLETYSNVEISLLNG